MFSCCAVGMAYMYVVPFFLWMFLCWGALNGSGGEVVTAPVPAEGSLALIPYPEHVRLGEGDLPLRSLSGRFMEVVSYGDDILDELEDVRVMFSLGDAVSTIGAEQGGMMVSMYVNGSFGEEEYTLNINQSGVSIAAGGFSGFFNALQTFKQLIVSHEGGCVVPCVDIQDKPAFAVRGVMLDVGRYYMSPTFIKRMVRRLSRYKINTLHLHLTDNPAWRLEVSKYPELTEASTHWKTRLPGKFYTKQELRNLVQYCRKLNIQVIPEIDMPGHAQAFTKATGTEMQTEKGIAILKTAVGEAASLFPGKYFHMGSDEVRITMKDFGSRMAKYIRGLGKEVVVWYPGHLPDKDATVMCWGENEKGCQMPKDMRRIDCNGFYIDWADSMSGVYQVFFQQPCEVPSGDDQALGGMLTVWCDGNLSGEDRVLEQYPFYPCALTFAERLWRGGATKRKDYMAQLPPTGSAGWNEFREFESRLVRHRDHFFRDVPFAYVQQADMAWSLIGPFDHQGRNDTSFEPERSLSDSYQDGDQVLKWKTDPVYGGAIHIRHLFAMFNMHQGRCRVDHWPTLMTPDVGSGYGTCYALTHIHSPKDQDVWLMFGLNGMWGHSGGYRNARAPEQGSWDFSGGDVWLNGDRVEPPHWPFKSLPWTDWGQGRIEDEPLTWEGYFFRPPVKIKLRKGVNRVLVRSVFGHWKGDVGQRSWFFCCVPVLWDGTHYREVPGLQYAAPYGGG